MLYPADRIVYITAFVTPVVEYYLEREIAQWIHHDSQTEKDIEMTTHQVTGINILRSGLLTQNFKYKRKGFDIVVHLTTQLIIIIIIIIMMMMMMIMMMMIIIVNINNNNNNNNNKAACMMMKCNKI